MNDLITVDLEDRERLFLTGSLVHWLGPMCVTEELTGVLGYTGWIAFERALHDRLLPRLHACEPLTRAEWFAVLAAAEIAFASDVYRGAADFAPCTGISDEEGIRLLRAVQRKIAPQVWSLLGAGVGTKRRYRRPTERPWLRADGAYHWVFEGLADLLGERPALALGHRVIAFASDDASAGVPAPRDYGVVRDVSVLEALISPRPFSTRAIEVWVFHAATPAPSFEGWRPLFLEPDVVTLEDPAIEFPDPPQTWPLAHVHAQRDWLRGCQRRLRDALAELRPLTFVSDDLVVTRDGAARASIEECLTERNA
ncbi:MAG: hypothetical protein K1X94_02650 [Sandaracinaceae bacterium]|nr:hypothetical protein [Sandaracinaceae bacterium]